MADSNEQKWSHKEIKKRIDRLKKAEKELSKLDIPKGIFDTDVEAIRAKLKSVPHVEEVEKELEGLKQKISQHKDSLKETASYEAKAKEAIEAAEKQIKQVKDSGYSVSEAEELLSQAREVFDKKDFRLAKEYADKANRSASEVKETAKPQIVVELEVDNYNADDWKAVDLGVVNQGKAQAKSIEFSFSDEIEAKWVTPIAELDAGARESLKIGLRPKNAGDIPLDVEISYKDISGTDYSGAQRFWLKVRRISESMQTIVDADFGVGLLPQLDNYTLEKKIGSGGFADVYLAKNAEGQTVAIKIPRLSGYETIESKDFLSEAELWSKLSKQSVPYIVELYEYGTAPYPWIAMEYMEGNSLRERMANLECKGCLEIAMKLMEALHAAHHYGVIHRDIKPENVLFDGQGTPKLTDWGLGKVLLEASMSSIGFRGTLAYSAPEQLASSRFGLIDWRTDIYQMGMMVYELLTGQLPFAGAEAGTSVTKILNEPLPAPSEIKREISPDLDDAVLRATAKKKEDRFQSMDAFKDRLEQVLKGL